MISPIKLYNTLTKQAEEFVPIVPNKVGMYSCGPTVYWHQHLGNMRTFISNDIIKRMFLANGYDVAHVINLTDVGHLANDEEDEGDDKMERKAKEEGRSVWDIAKEYTESFVSDIADLNVISPTYMPRATDFIAEQIEQIQKLEDLGFAYVIPEKGVYYDTSKFADYGKLSGQDLSKLRGGERVDTTGKRNHTDFLLWGFSPNDGTKREMEWESPWGIGWPGWSIECTAMGTKLLGANFDIHTGGQEHINIHHTNEIAQQEPSIAHKPWVHTWVHFGWLMGKDAKLSKSAGDALTVPLLKSKGYDPMAFRYMMLMGSYRSPMDFTWDALDAAAQGYKNIVKKVADIRRGVLHTPSGASIAPLQYEGWKNKILSAVNDNLKTAVALSVLQELLSDDATDAATKLEVIRFVDELLGLQFMDRAQKLLDAGDVAVPSEIVALADARAAAKAAKDWARADELRAEIDRAGYAVVDTPDGFQLGKK
ncbi:MAG: cysteine--tRNA ligase [Alphaproteobacteria bacterium]|nr:cysteine--tRNA ligase [Alphaproteobacteria bacterium]